MQSCPLGFESTSTIRCWEEGFYSFIMTFIKMGCNTECLPAYFKVLGELLNNFTNFSFLFLCLFHLNTMVWICACVFLCVTFSALFIVPEVSEGCLCAGFVLGTAASSPASIWQWNVGNRRCRTTNVCNPKWRSTKRKKNPGPLWSNYIRYCEFEACIGAHVGPLEYPPPPPQAYATLLPE